MGTLCDRTEDESSADEGSEIVKDSWSSEDGPIAPKVTDIEEFLSSMIAGVVDGSVTEVDLVSGGPKLLIVLSIFVARDVPSLRET